MKRVSVVIIGLVAAALAVCYFAAPEPFTQAADEGQSVAQLGWDRVAANPLPVVLAFCTLLLTYVYHGVKRKALRDVAAVTKASLVPPDPVLRPEHDNPVIKRAQARATRTQLLTDQVGIQARQRKLPEEITKAEKDLCYTEQALADARKKLAEKEKSHDESAARLEALLREQAGGEAELVEIDVELRKLADVV